MRDIKNYRYHKDSRYPEAKKYRDEAEELYVEMFNIDTGEALPVVDYKKVRREFADVANRAHLGIMACNKEIKK